MEKYCKFYLSFLAILLLNFAFPVQGWASSYYAELTVKVGDSSAGRVYAATGTTDSPSYGTADISVNDNTSAQNKQKIYYAWAKPLRGYEFVKWEFSGNGSPTCVKNNNGMADEIGVFTPNSDGTNTNKAIATANWITYQPCMVRLHSSSDGSYSINYKYTDYNDGEFKEYDPTISIAPKAETANVELYNTDLVTLNVGEGILEGWYSDAGFNNPISDAVIIESGSSYTLNVPDGGTLEIYPKFKSQPKLYGKLNVAFALGSAADGGQIALTDIKDAAPEYSSDPLSLSHTSFVSEGTKSIQQEYYLNAKSNIDVQYAFVGWFSSQIPSPTTLISMDAEYTYSFDVSSTDESHPTEQTIYAMFVRINMHYFEMTAEPQTPGLGMVLVAQNNEQTPGYNAYSNYSQVLAEEIGLADRAVETNFYLYATPKYGYQFDGWYSDAACTNQLNAANPYTYAASANSTDPNNPDKAHVYAKFKIATPFNVTFEKPTTPGNYAASIRDIVASDGEYVWGDIEIFNSANESSNKTLSMFPTSNLVLKATADDGNSIKSWKIGSSTVTTGASVYTTSATATTTFGATFGASSPFKVGSTTYSTLAAAIANLGTNKQITVVEDATVAPGNYTIPSGVTLLVPKDANNEVITTQSGTRTGKASNVAVYRKLTLESGCNIFINGNLNLSALLMGGQPCGGNVTGGYGQIDMAENSTITINDGGNLYCWGYITGKGLVELKNGAKEYEGFQLTCWRGGTAASSMVGKTQKVFPLSQYYIQNVETTLKINAGAQQLVTTAVSASSKSHWANDVVLVGTSSGLFRLSNGAYLIRKYNATEDRQEYLMHGNATLGSISMKVYININSDSYVLPITNNMSITLESGKLTLNKEVALLPGAHLTIKPDAEFEIQSSGKMYVYDSDDWGPYNYSGDTYVCPLPYSPTNSKIASQRTKSNMTDAVIDVQGKMTISGSLYTTSKMASICCSNNIGKIDMKAAAPGTATTYQATQSSSSISYVDIPVTPAQLRNGNGTYVQTAGAAANTTYTYFLGEWKKNLTIDGCFAVDDAGHKYISTEKGYKDVIDSEIYTAAWVSRDAPSVLYIHTVDNCDWLEVHTMTDNTIYQQDAEGNIYEYSSSNGYWVPATQYTATFKNFNDKVLYTTKVLPNGTPVYAGPTPIRTADDAGEYTFTGWNPAIGAINADTYYTAQYARTSNVVSVSVTGSTFYFTTWSAALDFANSLTSNPTIKLLDNISGLTANQTITKSMTIDLNGHELAGSAPLFKVNAAGINVTLTTNVEGGKVNATQVATETNGNFWITGGYFNALEAQLTPFVQDPYAVLPLTGVEGYSHGVGIAYTITFVDGDGKTIQSSKWAQGAMPSYSGATPTKTATAEYTYTFNGWTPAIVAVSADATYTATYTATKNKYTITFQNEDGTELQKTEVEYGATPSYTGTPTKAEDAQYTYTFKGWTPAIAPVSADATYTATYTETKKSYTLTWNLDGGEVKTAGTPAGSVEWGTSLTAPIVEKKGYTFNGWTPEVPATMPTANVTYTAQWAAQQEATYTVEHYHESALGVKEEKPFQTDEKQGLVGDQVSAEDVLDLEGYDSPTPSTQIIAADGSTVVEYYYRSRNLNVTKDVVIAGADLDQIVVGNAGTLSASTPSTTQRLVLTATPGNNDGANADLTNITIKESVCIEIEMNKSGTMDDKLYYCFSVPFKVNVDDGVERLHKDNDTWSKAVLNTNYRVYTYNEYDRATNGRSDNNWTPFNGPQFAPGVFYLCEFDNSNYNSYRFYAADKDLDNKKNIAVSNSKTGSEDGGWNGVANNGLTDNQLSGDFTYIQTLNSEYNCFEAAEASEKPLAIGNAAMVQVNATGSVLVGETPSAVAARRMGETASTEFINVRLYKENQDKHVDQIFIRASEDASDEYVAGIDLSKATIGTPKVARLWVNDYDLQLVANEALMTNDQATFSLGISAPANGEYTIALNEVPNNATIYLTENGSAIWNLNIAPAPISLSKGTENSYGLRLVRKINNVVTGFDEAVLNGNVQKVIMHDHLYIIRDGKVYSAHGHAIK